MALCRIAAARPPASVYSSRFSAALIRRAHARRRTTVVRYSPEPLAPDRHSGPGPGCPGRLRGRRLLDRTAALALAVAGRHLGLVFAAVRLHGAAPAPVVAGHRAGVCPATGLRPVYPQCLAVLLRRLDQPVRVVLPGAAGDRRGDPAVGVFADSLGHCPDRLQPAAGAVLPARRAADGAGQDAGLRHVAEHCPGGGCDHLLCRAHGRRAAPAGAAAFRAA
ncbi:hypothetical protein D3C71_1414920 [compost metagenome]